MSHLFWFLFNCMGLFGGPFLLYKFNDMDEVYDLLALENDAKLAIREEVKTKEPFLEN